MPNSKPIILFQNQFIAVHEREGYSYAHQVPNDGRTVVIVPFRYSGISQQYLARVEVCPAHSLKQGIYSITGGIEAAETPRAAAVRELMEESGYQIEATELIGLDTVRPSKQTDTIVYLYTVNLKNHIQFPIKGDGSQWEQDATVRWLSRDQAIRVNDALFLAAILRMEVQHGS